MIFEQLDKDFSTMKSEFKKTFTPHQRAKFYVQIAKDLKTLHQKHNLVHLDIKSQNLMFTDDQMNNVKFIDFGLSQFPEEEQEATNILGAAIEQMVFSPYYARFTYDVFAFGQLLCEIEIDMGSVMRNAINIIQFKF